MVSGMAGFFMAKAKTPQDAAQRIRKMIRYVGGLTIGMLVFAMVGLSINFVYGVSLGDTQIVWTAVGGLTIPAMALMISAYASSCHLDFMDWKPPKDDNN